MNLEPLIARWPYQCGGIRRRLIAGALLALLGAYVGGYAHLSRASLRVGADYGLDGILYVPFLDAFPMGGSGAHRSPARWRAIRRHYALATLFAPLNWVDRLVFGTPPPVSCFLTLSG